jgi:ligand-binding sensor protein
MHAWVRSSMWGGCYSSPTRLTIVYVRRAGLIPFAIQLFQANKIEVCEILKYVTKEESS